MLSLDHKKEVLTCHALKLSKYCIRTLRMCTAHINFTSTRLMSSRTTIHFEYIQCLLARTLLAVRQNMGCNVMCLL